MKLMNSLQCLIPQTLENRAALRTAIAVVVSILLAFKFHLDTPYWSGMTVVIVANLYTGSIIDKAILRIVGTICGAWFGYFIAGFVVGSFYLFLLANFLLIAVAVYHYIFSRYAYAYLLAGISGFIVVAQLALDPQNAFFVAIWRPVEIGLGVLVSAASAFCIFPNNIKDSLELQVENIFVALAKETELLNQVLSGNVPSVGQVETQNLQMKKMLKKAADMIGFMHKEAGIKATDIEQLHALLDLLYKLGRILNYFIVSQVNSTTTELKDYHELSIDAVFSAIHQDLNYLKAGFFAHHERQALRTGPALAALDAVLHQEQTPQPGTSYYQIRHLFKQINTTLIRLSNLLTTEEQAVIAKTHLLSPIARLRRDPDVIKQSIKVGLSAILALNFWLLTNWPGGLNGIISSLIISIKKNLFEMKQVSMYRLLGCLLGGGAALSSLAMMAMNLYNLLVILFILVWAFSYFSFKYTKYAYIGLQANIALIITLAQGGRLPVLLEPPLERLGGIVIGIVASFIVANILWRSDALSMLAGRLAKFFRLLSQNLTQVLIQDRAAIKLHDLSNLIWVCRGLIESFTVEHISISKQAKLEKLTQLFNELVIIHATINTIFDTINRREARMTAAALAVDFSECVISINQMYQRGNTSQQALIQQQLDNYLLIIQQTPRPAAVTNEQVINLVAYLSALSELCQNDSITLQSTLGLGKKARKSLKFQAAGGD